MISVIVPVYNVENYLEKCLDSILGQSYPYLEVLVVDDGSTDRSGRICDEYAKKDKRIRVFHQKNRGLSCARNLALDYASGDYVACVDSDDYLEMDMYESMVEKMDDETDIVCCGVTSVFPAERSRNYVQYKTDRCTKYNNQDAVRELFLGKWICFSSCDKLFRRGLFEGVRYPEGRICEDLPVTYRLVSKSRNVVHIGQAKYNYVYRSDSTSRKPFYPAKTYYAIFSRDIVKDAWMRYPALRREAKAWYIHNVAAILLDLTKSPERNNYKQLEQKLRRIIRKRMAAILKNPCINGKRKLAYIYLVCCGNTCIGRKLEYLEIIYRRVKGMTIKLKMYNYSCL